MQIKNFITHKRGASVASIQDSIAMDVERGRFALCDGVTNSVCPAIWADILTHAYVSVDDIQQFPPEGLGQLFLAQKESYVSALDEDQRYFQKLEEKHFKVGAATFVGIELRENVLSWQVIGDSCLFILPDGELIQCISSNPSHTDEEGHLNMEFDDFPCHICSDGYLSGEWIKGCRPFSKGRILLMSDKMSEWFVEQFNQGNSPLDQLNAINYNDEFELFVEEKYQQGELKDDDESVILISVGDDLRASADETTNVNNTESEDEAEEVAKTEEAIAKVPTTDVEKTVQIEDVKPAEEIDSTENAELAEENEESYTTIAPLSLLEEWKNKCARYIRAILYGKSK